MKVFYKNEEVVSKSLQMKSSMASAITQVMGWLRIKKIVLPVIIDTRKNGALSGAHIAIIYFRKLNEKNQKDETLPIGKFLLHDGIVVKNIYDSCNDFSNYYSMHDN